MKFTRLAVIALVLLWTVAAGNNLKEEKADPISSMFSNVFGMMSEKAVNQVMEHQKQVDPMELDRAIFKGPAGSLLAQAIMNKAGTISGNNKGEILDILKQFPKDLALPQRRKPASFNLDNLSPELKKHHKGKGKGSGKENFGVLNEFLNELKKSGSQDAILWESPAFLNHQKTSLMTNYQIFGQKLRSKTKHPSVNRQKIEDILISKIPFLSQGRIVNIVTTSYKKGFKMIIEVLNPDTETEEEKLYTLTARYKPKRHIMEIIQFKESENMMGRRQKDEIIINEQAKVIGNPQQRGMDFNEKNEQANLPDETFNNDGTEDKNQVISPKPIVSEPRKQPENEEDLEIITEQKTPIIIETRSEPLNLKDFKKEDFVESVKEAKIAAQIALQKQTDKKDEVQIDSKPAKATNSPSLSERSEPLSIPSLKDNAQTQTSKQEVEDEIPKVPTKDSEQVKQIEKPVALEETEAEIKQVQKPKKKSKAESLPIEQQEIVKPNVKGANERQQSQSQTTVKEIKTPVAVSKDPEIEIKDVKEQAKSSQEAKLVETDEAIEKKQPKAKTPVAESEVDEDEIVTVPLKETKEKSKTSEKRTTKESSKKAKTPKLESDTMQ